jgi:predicted type IV restriction endonuclease
MQALNLPTFPVKVIEKEKKRLIFDFIRNKYVALTPEEWVRQHFVNYLITDLSYPKELIANEMWIKLNNTSKRCDTIVYNRFLEPLVIIEYKAPYIKITDSVFEQIVHYNVALHVKYLIVSNGMTHYCCKINYKDLTYNFLKEIPSYSTLNNSEED